MSNTRGAVTAEPRASTQLQLSEHSADGGHTHRGSPRPNTELRAVQSSCVLNQAPFPAQCEVHSAYSARGH